MRIIITLIMSTLLMTSCATVVVESQPVERAIKKEESNDW